MKSYVWSEAGSGATTEFFAESDKAAIKQILSEQPEGTVVAYDWDADGQNDDGDPCKRILFWASEEDAKNDPGANAIGQLETVGQA